MRVLTSVVSLDNDVLVILWRWSENELLREYRLNLVLMVQIVLRIWQPNACSSC